MPFRFSIMIKERFNETEIAFFTELASMEKLELATEKLAEAIDQMVSRLVPTGSVYHGGFSAWTGLMTIHVESPFAETIRRLTDFVGDRLLGELGSFHADKTSILFRRMTRTMVFSIETELSIDELTKLIDSSFT